MGNIQRVTVAGAGAMGSQIAVVAAFAGFEVRLADIDASALRQAEHTLKQVIGKRVQKGNVSQTDADAAFSRLYYMDSLETAVHETDLLIEAVVEKVNVKRELFRAADRIAPDHAIFATNSSTIVSSRLADATERSDRVCNMHFFNPVLVMEAVEVVQGPHTSEATAQAAVAFVQRLRKTPILLKKEVAGFVANRLVGKLIDEAIALLESGVATVEDIDLACTKALNHPIGPFALLDMAGIDVNYYTKMALYEATGDESQKPQKTIEEKFLAGEFGRKTGKGFYRY